MEVPKKVKKDIESIKVINLSKLESKLSMQKPLPGGAKAHVMSLLSQQFIPNIVQQYNLRHQIQSNQILIDFQTHNENPASQTDQTNAGKQIRALQRSLQQAQETQAKIQNEILEIFDQYESPPAPTRPAQDQELLESLKKTVESQKAEIGTLREELTTLQRSPAKRRKADPRPNKSASPEKGDAQLAQEVKSLELVINDKNIEIEMLRQKEAEKYELVRNERDTAVEENNQLRRLVRNLEKQVSTQAQKLQRKDVLIEDLKQSSAKLEHEGQQPHDHGEN